MTASEMREFSAYLRNCTDAQVQGCHDKEHAAGRSDYEELCLMEAERRGITLDTWSTESR